MPVIVPLSSIHSIARIKDYGCLKNMIHRIGSKNEYFFQQVLRQNLGWFLHWKTLFLRGFILKTTERA